MGLKVAVKGYVALRREQPALALLRSASAPLPTVVDPVVAMDEVGEEEDAEDAPEEAAVPSGSGVG